MEQLWFGGVAACDANIIHDSAKRVFRDPPGAVTGGTSVSLSLKIDKIYIEQAALCVLRDGAIERHVLAPEGDVLRIHYGIPDDCEDGGCVLWYWFEITLQGGAICYYGAEPPYTSGLGRIYRNPPPAFQITVYDPGFSTPGWAKDAVMYQIFPDRFCMGDADGVRAGVEYHRAKGRTEIELHENWDGLPVYEAKDGQKYYMPSDIFGGDLEGIRQQLPYLAGLGVTVIYLNPVFEAASNHRCNTGDYLKIDPILGGGEAFRRLAGEAAEAGIRILLDGVFSHTGDDSLYFNKYGRYDSVGAYQSKESLYYGWYRFGAHPEKYDSWWGFETLPEVSEEDLGWQEYVIAGEDSVVRHWIGEGAAGYRLDVADELPDDTIQQIREAVKEADPEAFLLGEVWEDATTKQSYGRRRTYALGLGLDSVMNYPFLELTIAFLKGKTDAWHYCRFLEDQRQNYPAPMYYTLMNLISSHDVCRARSVLSGDFDIGSMSRREQADFRLSVQEYELGGRRQRLAAAIQFSLPGIPSVYYGDEVGMTGLLDPFNRRPFCEEDASLLDWYRKLSAIRRANPVMSTGEARFFSTNGNVLGILRHTVNGCDAFGRGIGAAAVLTVVNPTEEPHRIVFDFGELSGALPEGSFDGAVWESLHPDAGDLTGRGAVFEKGLAEIDIPPLGVEIFRNKI